MYNYIVVLYGIKHWYLWWKSIRNWDKSIIEKFMKNFNVCNITLNSSKWHNQIYFSILWINYNLTGNIRQKEVINNKEYWECCIRGKILHYITWLAKQINQRVGLVLWKRNNNTRVFIFVNYIYVFVYIHMHMHILK